MTSKITGSRNIENVVDITANMVHTDYFDKVCSAYLGLVGIAGVTLNGRALRTLVVRKVSPIDMTRC